MLLIAYEVLTRKFFNISTPALVDIVSLSMLIVTFCSLSGIQREGQHIRIDILVDKLKGKARYFFQLFESIIVLVTCLFLTNAAFRVFIYILNFNAVSEGARIPKWYFVVFVPISLTILCIRIILQIIKKLSYDTK